MMVAFDDGSADDDEDEDDEFSDQAGLARARAVIAKRATRRRQCSQASQRDSQGESEGGSATTSRTKRPRGATHRFKFTNDENARFDAVFNSHNGVVPHTVKLQLTGELNALRDQQENARVHLFRDGERLTAKRVQTKFQNMGACARGAALPLQPLAVDGAELIPALRRVISLVDAPSNALVSAMLTGVSLIVGHDEFRTKFIEVILSEARRFAESSFEKRNAVAEKGQQQRGVSTSIDQTAFTDHFRYFALMSPVEFADLVRSCQLS